MPIPDVNVTALSLIAAYSNCFPLSPLLCCFRKGRVSGFREDMNFHIWGILFPQMMSKAEAEIAFTKDASNGWSTLKPFVWDAFTFQEIK